MYYASLLPKLRGTLIAAILCHCSVTCHGNIAGSIFLTLQNGQPYPLADVEIQYCSGDDLATILPLAESFKAELARLQAPGLAARNEIKRRSAEFALDLTSRETALRLELVDLENEQTRFASQHGKEVAAMEVLRAEADRQNAKQRSVLAAKVAEINQRLSNVKPIGDEAASIYGVQVVKLLRNLGDERHIATEDLIKTSDVAVILQYTSDVTQANPTGHKEGTYYYPISGLYFINITDRVSSFPEYRYQLVDILEKYLHDSAEMVRDQNAKRDSDNVALLDIVTQMHRLEEDHSVVVPRDLKWFSDSLEEFSEKTAEKNNYLSRMGEAKDLLKQGDVDRIIGYSFRNSFPPQLQDLIGIVVADIDTEGARIHRKLLEQATDAIISQIRIVRSNAQGLFVLPADSVGILAVYEDPVHGPGRKFVWLCEIKAGEPSITLTLSNCAEERHVDVRALEGGIAAIVFDRAIEYSYLPHHE